MKGISYRGLGKTASIFIVTFITLSAVLLAVLQFSWISRAAGEERLRLWRSLGRDGTRAIENAFDEVRLVSTIIQAALDTSDRETATIKVKTALNAWEEQTIFDSIVTGVWLFFENGEATFVTGGSAGVGGAVKTGSLPETGMQSGSTGIPEVLKRLQEAQFSPDALSVAGRYGYSVVRVSTPGQSGAFAAVDIDKDRFFEDLLPQYLDRSFDSVPYHIVRYPEERNAESVTPERGPRSDDRLYVLSEYAESGNDTSRRDRRLFLSFIIPGFMTDSWRETRGVRGFSGQPAELLIPPAEYLHPALEESHDQLPNAVRSESGESSFPPLKIPFENNSIGRVDILVSQVNINREIQVWIATNVTISVGVLLLLLASLFVMYSLYRRTGNLRAMEREFVASMSHELRMPITVIKAIADNLSAGIVTNRERLVQYGKEIGVKAERLSSMIEGILLYSGLQSGNRQSESTPFDADMLIEELSSEFRRTAEAAGVRLERMPGQPIGTIVTDEKGFRTVLENLLYNAVTHAFPLRTVSSVPDSRDPARNVQSSVQSSQIPVQNEAASVPAKCMEEVPLVRFGVFRRPLHRLAVVVEDNGYGVPKKEQLKIFEPFVRSERSVSTRRPGSGLGLHLIKRIAELSSGSVVLESPYADAAGRMHRGCRFTVELKTGDLSENAPNSSSER